MDMKYANYLDLLLFAKDIFLSIGCSEEHAGTAANVLLSADLRGVDSHGIARLNGYVRLWEAGRINVNPNMKVIHETPSTAVIDGDSGLGLVVGPFSMEVAMQKANQVGTGWVSVNNSNHYGIAGYHAMLALEKDMIGISMTNASALVAPTFSKERMLGTNPIAFAIPAGNQPPFVLDMATTTASNGKLEIAQRNNENIPIGWAQDEFGNPSTDSNILKKNGALLPLGGDKIHGSHKGYGLGSVVDIFSAVLSGAAYGPWVPPFPDYVPMPENPPGKGLGHFFGALRTDAFRPVEEYKKQMDHWIESFRKAKSTASEKVLIPGDIEREMELIRKNKGIPLQESVKENLIKLAEKRNINHEFLK